MALQRENDKNEAKNPKYIIMWCYQPYNTLLNIRIDDYIYNFIRLIYKHFLPRQETWQNPTYQT